MVKIGLAVLSKEHFVELMFGTLVDYKRDILQEQNAETDIVLTSISSTDPPVSVSHPPGDLKKSSKVIKPFLDKKCGEKFTEGQWKK